MTLRFIPMLVLAVLGLTHPVLAEEPERVTMRLEEFLRMYEQSRNRPDKPGKPPIDTTLSQVKYEATVRTDERGEPTSVVFSTAVRLDRHGEGWTRIPLLSGETSLIEATLDGRPAAISLTDGWYQLITNRTGTFDVKLTFAANVQSEQGASSFSFPLPQAGASTLQLIIPGSDPLEVSVARARILRDEVSAGKRYVEATFPSWDRLAVRWQRSSTGQAPGEKQVARIYAETHTLVGVGDGLLRATANVQHTILFAGVDTFRYDLPDGMTVLDVRGAGLRDWTIGADGNLTVQLSYAAENSASFAIELEQVIGEGSRSLSAPIVLPLGVERSKGFVGVTAAGSLEIAAGDVKAATPVDVRTLPADILGITKQPVLLGYKYLASDVKIPLQVTQHELVDVLVTLLDQAEATTMFTEDGRRLTSVIYQVRNNRRQYLHVQLPKEAELWSAAVAGRSVQPAKSSDGAILMPLLRSTEGGGGTLSSFPVEVVYVESMPEPDAAGAGTFSADLPLVDVPTTWLGWTVYAPSRARISKNAFDGSIRHVDWFSRPVSASESLQVEYQEVPNQQAAQGQVSSGTLGSGAAPVRVELPLEGQPYYFEKVLVLDERLWVEFAYRGLK